MAAPPAHSKCSYLGASAAASLDAELMGESVGFSLDQLMELAGLSCAQAVQHFYPSQQGQRRAVLVVCGPGNNGGDGLVCARHLTQFGFDVTVEYPKEAKKELYQRLLRQLRADQVRVVQSVSDEEMGSFSLVVDAIFGFSFDPKDGIREPYQGIIQRLVRHQRQLPIASIDVPSGWDVDSGPAVLASSLALRPELLISLTAPKPCAAHFEGKHHALGGRFMPRSLLDKYDLTLPPYPGSAQFADISHLTLGAKGDSSASASARADDAHREQATPVASSSL